MRSGRRADAPDSGDGERSPGAVRSVRSRLGLGLLRARARVKARGRKTAATVHDWSALAWSATRAATTPKRRRKPVDKRILMLTISHVDGDPRINKVARSLADHGYQVDVMAPSWNGTDAEHEAGPGVRYVWVAVPWTGSRFYFVHQKEFKRSALRRDFDYVHANDLTTLTVAWALARIRRVPLIYDAHELWTENVEFNGAEWVPMSRRTRVLAGRWERLLLRDVDLLVTVGPSIVAEFQRRDHLKRPPLLLANYPSLTLLEADGDRPSIRTECGLTESHFVTLYLGGVNPLRNIESVIRAHRYLPEDHVFVVRGPSVEAFSDEYRALARDVGVEDRVFFLPPVEMDDLIAGAAGADCGILMLRNICKNFYFFYPNKLFEYALAGLPIAASDFPDVSRFVRDERCGVTFDPESPESIASALLSLSGDREEARAMGERGRASILAGKNWEAAVEELVEAYRALG